MEQLLDYKNAVQALHEQGLALVPVLSTQLVKLGHHERRTLLTLGNWSLSTGFSPTPQWWKWHEYSKPLSAEAKCQMWKINNAGYNIAENISLMLEQGDYWKNDLCYIILLAEAYINGEFNREVNK